MYIRTRVAFRKWMMGGQNVELSVARLNVCTVLHVKPEKNLGGQEATKGGANAPLRPPLNATLRTLCWWHIACMSSVHARVMCPILLCLCSLDHLIPSIAKRMR